MVASRDCPSGGDVDGYRRTEGRGVDNRQSQTHRGEAEQHDARWLGGERRQVGMPPAQPPARTWQWGAEAPYQGVSEKRPTSIATETGEPSAAMPLLVPRRHGDRDRPSPRWLPHQSMRTGRGPRSKRRARWQSEGGRRIVFRGPWCLGSASGESPQAQAQRRSHPEMRRAAETPSCATPAPIATPANAPRL